MAGGFQSLKSPEKNAGILPLPAEIDRLPQQTVADALRAQRVGENEPAQRRAFRLSLGAIDGNRTFDTPAPDGSPEAIFRGIEAAQERGQFGCDLGFEIDTEIPGFAVIARVQLRHPAYGSRNVPGDGDLSHFARTPGNDAG